jgi:hypothetical protein
MEFHIEVQCAHCGADHFTSVQFDERCADTSGVDSNPTEAFCNECCKEFWFDARLNFEVEPMNIWKQKP